MKDLKDFIQESLVNEAKFEQGSWHGDDAWILDRDKDGVTILIGSYSEKEVKDIYKLYQKDDPDIEEYEIEYVENDEWEEQQ